MENNLKKIGKIKSAHGIKGELFVIIFSKDVSWVKNDLKFFLHRTGKPFLPFNLLKYKIHKEGLIISVQDITTRNQAEELLGFEFSISADHFKSKNGESLYLSEIEYFDVEDSLMGPVGKIIGFSSNGVQDLLIVENHSTTPKSKPHQYEIPFVKEFIIDVDHQLKVVKTSLPEGLLEINLESEQKK